MSFVEGLAIYLAGLATGALLHAAFAPRRTNIVLGDGGTYRIETRSGGHS